MACNGKCCFIDCPRFYVKPISKRWVQRKPGRPRDFRISQSLFFYNLLCKTAHMSRMEVKQNLVETLATSIFTPKLKPNDCTNANLEISWQGHKFQWPLQIHGHRPWLQCKVAQCTSRSLGWQLRVYKHYGKTVQHNEEKQQNRISLCFQSAPTVQLLSLCI